MVKSENRAGEGFAIIGQNDRPDAFLLHPETGEGNTFN
jgi:hypothetical protein